MPRQTEAPRPANFINWGGFQLAMLTNQAYSRISQTAIDQRTTSRVELYFAQQVENWPLISQLWAQMLASCPAEQRPTAAESAAWTQIASANSLPIVFSEAGQLIEKPPD